MKMKRMVTLAMLTGVSLILFIIELRIPNLLPIPGVKLGLANIVTVYAVFRYRPQETALMVTARILLGAMFSGTPSALLYSAAGAVCCLLGMLVLRHILPEKQIWLCSVIGAMLHNIGQITAAVIIMRSFGVIAYLPLLLVTGSLAGVFTGICARHFHMAEAHPVPHLFRVGDGHVPARFVDGKGRAAPENAHHVAKIIGKLGRGRKNRYVHRLYNSRS